MRKVKILMVTLVAGLLVASPAFAFDAETGFLTETEFEGAGLEAETGFLTETEFEGAGFELEAGSIFGD